MSLNTTTKPYESTYHDVAAYVNSCDCNMERAKISLAFPDMPARRLAKALENACNKRLIHSVDRGVYRGGPKPLADTNSAPDTTHVVPMALRNRLPIERAWMSFCQSGSMGSMAAA